jgi:hypothetical protein
MDLIGFSFCHYGKRFSLPFLLDTHKSSLNLSAYGVHSAKSAYDARFFRKIHYMTLPKYGLLELDF